MIGPPTSDLGPREEAPLKTRFGWSTTAGLVVLGLVAGTMGGLLGAMLEAHAAEGIPATTLKLIFGAFLPTLSALLASRR